MGCSSSKRRSVDKSPPSITVSTPDSVPILVPAAAGYRMRASCSSTPDSTSSMIILPLFPGRVTTLVRSTLSSGRTTPLDEMQGEVCENVVIAVQGGPLLYPTSYKRAAGSASDSVLQHTVHFTTSRTGNHGDSDQRAAPCQSMSSHDGSSSDHGSARSTPTKFDSAIQETATAALNLAGYAVVHAPSPPGSGTATPVHSSLRRARPAHVGQYPNTPNKSTDLAIMQASKQLPATAGAALCNGTSKVVPTGVTPASSRHTSRSSSASSSPSLSPKQPRQPKKVPLPSSSHYRHGHRYRKPAFPTPKNASTLRYANLDHSSVLSFSNLDFVNSFTKDHDVPSAKQSALKDAEAENVNVSGGFLNTDIHHGTPKKQQPRDIVVINGSPAYVTNADGQKLGAFHQPSILPEEEIKQVKPKVPIPVPMPIDGVPAIQSQTAHHSISSISNIPVIQAGAAPKWLPADFSGGVSESSSSVSSSSSNVVDNNPMAATFQEMMGQTDLLGAPSWSSSLDRKGLLEPNMTQKVLQECRSLEAKLGFYNRDAVINSVEIQDEAASFRSDSTSGDDATYKHLCA